MKTMMQKLYVKVTGALQNEKGAQAVEWIALAGVVIVILGAIQGVFKDGGDTAVGKAVSKTLSNIIKGIKGDS
ncbi:hypothetical protein NDK47_26890 [Brevibacillus ruminantium]|uniref:Flp family type IVb pilin n=1 Tax=Brevibacillus ruminantium TaxID=2950604 RepID=A0ABY4WEX2_9BACL|nr:hypothetical protein [Brevibacillus ruminantium]USG65682.1 hypothetical protein NDK47_26890 [Brevibacillus ruminantium]